MLLHRGSFALLLAEILLFEEQIVSKGFTFKLISECVPHTSFGVSQEAIK